MAEKGIGPLADEPEVYADLRPVYDAFWALSASRQVTMGGAGGIPFEAIDRYAARFDVEDFEEFFDLLTAMDRTYLNHDREKK